MTHPPNIEDILKDKDQLTALSALSMACLLYDLPDMRELWNQAYPETPLTDNDAATLMFEGMEESARIKYDSPDDRSLIVDLLKEAGFTQLAEVAAEFLD